MSELEKLRTLDKAMLTPAEVAGVLGCDPQYIRLQAQVDPTKLPFPTMRIGSRTKIPRLPFLQFVEGGAQGW